MVNQLKPHSYFFTDSSNSLERAKARLVEAVEKSGKSVRKIIGGKIVRETAPYQAQAFLDVEVG